MTTANTASLPTAAQADAVVVLGTPVAVRRRLLDLTVPVTITGLGAAASTASAAATALSSSSSLAAFATAGGATSASATAPGAPPVRTVCYVRALLLLPACRIII
jgi:hypothetical protein